MYQVTAAVGDCLFSVVNNCEKGFPEEIGGGCRLLRLERHHCVSEALQYWNPANSDTLVQAIEIVEWLSVVHSLKALQRFQCLWDRVYNRLSFRDGL